MTEREHHRQRLRYWLHEARDKEKRGRSSSFELKMAEWHSRRLFELESQEVGRCEK